MNVLEAVRTVLAVRRYADRPVEAAVVRRIVDAARLSASSMNLQPWHFIVVQDRATLGKIGAAMKTGPYAANAAFAVVVAVEKASPYAVSDASRAVQNMILVAWAEGIGSNWTGFGPMPAIEKLLGVPATHEGLAVVPFGYPEAKLSSGRKKRKPIGDVVSRDRFGTPFA